MVDAEGQAKHNPKVDRLISTLNDFDGKMLVFYQIQINSSFSQQSPEARRLSGSGIPWGIKAKGKRGTDHLFQGPGKGAGKYGSWRGRTESAILQWHD